MATLQWVDDRITSLDHTCVFGKGYDFHGLDNLAQYAKGPNGNYMIWPDRDHRGRLWSLYRDSDGAMAFQRYPDEASAKAAAEDWCRDK